MSDLCIVQKTTCETCTRSSAYSKRCKVFKEPPQDCWAWTDDPDWERKVKKAIQEYSDRLKEES